MTIGQFRSLLSAIVALFVLATSSGSGQTEWHNIGGKEYGKYDGTWYALSNGSIGDRLDTSKIIVLPKSVSEADLNTYLMEHLPQLRILGTRPGGFIAIQVGSNTDAMKVAKALESTGLFTSMFFNHFYRCSAVPNDPLYSSQWHLPKTFVPDAWQLATGNGTTIAVIDNGGDWEHEDLYGNLSAEIGFDFVDNDDDPYPGDEYGHGTACAGVIGAVTNNGTGVAGVAGGWGMKQAIGCTQIRRNSC